MLDIAGLRVSYGAMEVVHGLDLHLEAGDFVTVLGANGAGKTTMMRGICGLASHVSTRLTVAGKEVSKQRTHVRVDAGISLVPEGREVFPTLSVVENLHAAYDSKRGVTRAFDAAMSQVVALFPRLSERTGQLAGTLSGGEQQMLAIGRALVQEPRVLLLDEPSLGLAPIMVDDVMAALTRLNRDGLTILMVEQDTARALEVASRALVVRNGRVVLSEPSQVLQGSSDLLREAIFGA